MDNLITSTRRIPKYVTIAESLKSDMDRGLLSPDDQLPSFNEMTERFQVAKHTIDKAHALLEKEGLVRREQGRGVFVESPKKKLTGNIGLLLPDTTQQDRYTRELLGGIQQQARVHNFNLMLMDERTPITRKSIDGILLFSDSHQIASFNLPVRMPSVLMLAPAAGVKIANVVADDFGGAKLATQHLLELGHRRISCMLAAEHDAYSQQRLAGYRSALDEAHIQFDEQLCFYINEQTPPAHYVLSGETQMKLWISRGWKQLEATAILAPNDDGAFGIMRVLEATGMRVPADVSVVGFDGVGVSASEETPLTTIQVPLREIGACAAELLWKKVQKGGSVAEKIALPVQLIAGHSTTSI